MTSDQNKNMKYKKHKKERHGVAMESRKHRKADTGGELSSTDDHPSLRCTRQSNGSTRSTTKQIRVRINNNKTYPPSDPTE